MALLDFFNRRNQDSGAEMSFIDHLEALRWHIIRSVIAVLIGAIIVFIYAQSIVDKVILGPAHPGFITYKWLCDAGHALHLGVQGGLGGDVATGVLHVDGVGQLLTRRHGRRRRGHGHLEGGRIRTGGRQSAGGDGEPQGEEENGRGRREPAPQAR